jgi:signal transduction histidine kinase
MANAIGDVKLRIMLTPPGRATATFLLAGAVMLGMPLAKAAAGLDWLSPELRRIEELRQAEQQKLAALPPAPAPQLTQRLGWHSDYSAAPDTIEWVELNLGHAERLDAVVLIAPPPSGGAAEPGYGFPLRFRVELLGDDEQTERTVIADYTREDFPNPGSLPVVIPAGGRAAHKVRITATRLFRKGNRYLFALGEVMLLQGQRNLSAPIEVAGPAAVHASSSQGTRPDWGRINLVDGQTVLGPPVGVQPSPTLGFRSLPQSEKHAKGNAWVSVDLGRAVPIEEVRLFPAHPPQFEHSHGYGFPVRYQIELRTNEETPPVILPAPQSGSYTAPPGDNVITVVAANQVARLVRLVVLEPHVSNGSAVLALAEMQVWSGGQNIAAGKSVTASDSTEQDGWSNAALVDGLTSEAEIVDWPGWLAGLSQRREIEHQLGLLEARRTALTRQWQRVALVTVAGFVVAGMASALFWSLRQRRERRAELEALRQRIAQDLHDEIGSSLGSIALIAQDVLACGGDPTQAHDDLLEIKEIADETVSAMRDITRLIQSDRYGADDLATLLSETATRLLHGLEHTLTVESAPHGQRLPVNCQRDLILMFKETLHNIMRHAAATTVDIQLAQSGSQLILTVHDNGRGFDPAAPHGTGMGLTNLQRRSAKHGGSVHIESTPSHGTTVRIHLPNHA